MRVSAAPAAPARPDRWPSSPPRRPSYLCAAPSPKRRPRAAAARGPPRHHLLQRAHPADLRRQLLPLPRLRSGIAQGGASPGSPRVRLRAPCQRAAGHRQGRPRAKRPDSARSPPPTRKRSCLRPRRTRRWSRARKRFSSAGSRKARSTSRIGRSSSPSASRRPRCARLTASAIPSIASSWRGWRRRVWLPIRRPIATPSSAASPST